MSEEETQTNEGGDDVQARIDEAVSGLKKTNSELKAEKTELKKQAEALATQFESLGGEEGVHALVEMRKRLENDETGKLLAEGKHEDWFEKRSAAMKADYEKKLAAYDQQLQERDQALQGAQSTLHNTLLDVGIGKACDGAEVKDAGSREHARMLAERQFTFDAELGQHVIKDADGGVVIGKDGKSPKSMQEWIEEKREVPEYRVWWGRTQPAGLSNGSLPSQPDKLNEAVGNMSMAQFRAWRNKQKEGMAS